METKQAKAFEAYDKKEFERAATLLREAAEAGVGDEERERLLVKCAMAQDELGRHAEALATLKEALELNPDSTAGWNNLGIVCQHIGKLEEARTAFERAYKLNPAQADPLVNLGTVCLRQGDPGNALQYLQLAAELLPGHPAVHANLALTYAVFGRLEEAEDSLRLAVLYGFDQAAGIEEKITALKKVRDKIISDAQAPETGPGASTDSPDMADSPDMG